MLLLNKAYKVLHWVLHLPCTTETGASRIRMVFTRCFSCLWGDIYEEAQSKPEEPLMVVRRKGQGQALSFIPRPLFIFTG